MASLAPLFLWLFFQSGLQLTDWRTYTSHRTVRDVVSIGGSTWVGTSGGLFTFPNEQQDFRLFTNTDGLSGTDITALAVDDQSRLWLGMASGALHRLDPGTEELITVVIETDNFIIRDIAVRSNELFLASNLGISRYLIDQGEVKETYRKLGVFERDTPVQTILLDGNDLWAGTDRGIARASLSAPNLQDPQFWTTYTTTQGLPSAWIMDLQKLNGALYAATTAGVARFDGAAWRNLPAGLYSTQSRSLTLYNNMVTVATPDEVFQLNSSDIWTPLSPSITQAVRLTPAQNGGLWIGTGGEGLRLRRADGTVTAYLPDGPAGSSFNDMAVDRNGNVWAATGNDGNRGIYRFDGQGWRNYTTAEGLPSMNVTTAFVDAQNGKWFGLPGDGMVLISADEQLVTVIDETNGLLSPAATEHFTIVEDFALDSRGNVWLANKFADNGRALVAVTPEFQFHYFSVSEGLGSRVISALAVDKQDRIWIGSVDQSGIRVLNWGGTLSNRSDDHWAQVTTADGLPDNNINAITVDQTGTVWIGTPTGAAYFNGSELRRVFGLIDNQVNTIAADAFSNKWFGTRGGVSILDRDNARLTHVTTGNSPLIDDNIFSIVFKAATGEVFFGTGSGLSRARTPFLLEPEPGEDMTVFPNPYLLDTGAAPVIIGDFELDTIVKIFTGGGRFIRTLTAENGDLLGSKALWDGCDQQGRLVASGVYIIVASTFRGDVQRGKLAVIRR